LDPDGRDVKSFLLLIKGPNHVPNAAPPELGGRQASLGPVTTSTGVFFVLNTQAIFDPGDNPANYEPIREAFVLRKVGEVAQHRTGRDENPDREQIVSRGDSQFVFDSPGAHVERGPRAALDGYLHYAFKLSVKDKTTGKVSDKTFYYHVRLVIRRGTLVDWTASELTLDQFNALIGRKDDNQ